ncbi:hypothetical protein [Rhodococcus opacus]|uniref:hypothetical protein n=1 Tax=Rhodococcus opacus TaxID=37919 RepID=UPI00080BB782|nr:hypothetical protein [Rhodococcus opacus]
MDSILDDLDRDVCSDAAKSAAIARAEAEVEAAKAELALAIAENEKAKQELLAARDLAAEKREIWLADSRVFQEPWSEVAERLFARSLEELRDLIMALEERCDSITESLESGIAEGRLRTAVAEAQIDLMDVRNELMHKANEVRYHGQNAEMDVASEMLEIANDVVTQLDDKIDMVEDVGRGE